ncbi:MAG: type I secretion protein TolC [Zetaproteobacteria bacterium CG12_big_fil_rev_8_21_14_0_65_54_13]|nr:MAG: type I secretion protein TolC [Zetaproteobacteria bacterium CG23_combo_of_CG06-09_8_20_14_all_54_7]PIW47039.1 MAG: type I secretion protein TolC [Zetaproteobacteria bacterium CG12_big_fil_rev_8_21_14_0_65_54_13]PIX53878.1 MAG: type I secretion protein TolC [Zetaproteobacteria bacterium CG_4_10_14_3_um_filter_54_28]PJA28599.1 MAG: type I secretion protein TolC [Zetaproteobacteria bacterium CG_4_9_14_3_um_filter_54_145]
MKRLYLACTAVMLLTPTLCAQPVSLSQAVNDALAHAPALQSAEAGRMSALEDEKLGRAWLLPYVVASGSWKKVREDIAYDRPIAFPLATELNMHKSEYGIKAFQPLFDLEKWSYYEQGKASAAMGEAALQQARRQTVLAAASAWLDVMRAGERLKAAMASEQAMNRLAEQAEASFKVGLEPVNTSLAAASRRDLTRVQRIRAEQVLNQAGAVLSSLLGHAAVVSASIDGMPVPLRLNHVSEQEWLALAEAADQVQLAERSVEMAEADKMKALGGALPKVQLVAGWDKQRSSSGTFGTGSRVQSASIGVEFSMPLYAGGGTWAQQRKSEQEKIRADADLDEAQRQAQLATRQAWLQWQATGSELDAMKAALISARSEREAAHAGFEAGLRTMSEVLDAEDRLASARAGLADSVASHGLSVLQLYAAVGALDTDQVTVVQEWLAASAG